MLKLYVTYFIAQPQKVGQRLGSNSTTDSDRIADVQRQAVNEFIDTQENADVLETFIE